MNYLSKGDAMTIARDVKTGRILGQVTNHRTEHLDRFGRLLYVSLRLLTRNGVYVSIPEPWLTLEKVS